MSPLDLLIAAGVVSALVGGYRLGFLARITSWAGLALGIVLGLVFLPEVVEYFTGAEPGVRALAAVAFLLAAGMLGQGIGLALGAALHATLRIGPGLRQYDRWAGGITGAIGMLVVFWALTPSLANVDGAASRWTRDSVILRTLANMATPPDSLRDLRHLLGDISPQVFEDLDRNPDAGAAPGATQISQQVHRRVLGSTLKIQGQACRKVQEGTGYVAAPDVVVTNAHVVAGEPETEVATQDGRVLDATVVVFDPDRDLAVLRVPNLGLEPLPLATAEDGMVGGVYGHPGGGNLEVSPARISQQVTAVGRDIYDQSRTRRDVFVLASELRPGDSGGPLVNPRGEVVGVAFAIAPDRRETAYALTDGEVRAVLESVPEQRADTGPCLV